MNESGKMSLVAKSAYGASLDQECNGEDRKLDWEGRNQLADTKPLTS